MVTLCCDSSMEIQDVRRRRLREFIDAAFDGNIAGFAAHIHKSPTQIADMLAGRKSFGEKVARDLERRAKLPEGTLDASTPQTGTTSQNQNHEADMLHTAVRMVEQVLHELRVSATPEARAEITMAAYEDLREGRDMQAAKRAVTRMLRAMGGVRPTTTE